MQQMDLFGGMFSEPPVKEEVTPKNAPKNSLKQQDPSIEPGNDNSAFVNEIKEEESSNSNDVIVDAPPAEANSFAVHSVYVQPIIDEPLVKPVPGDVKNDIAPMPPIRQEKTSDIIFSDGKIMVKVKAKPTVKIEAPVNERKEKLPTKKGRKSFKEIDAEVDLIEIPDDETLFQKQYYPISEVAKWFRVNTSVVRFWEIEFDILKPRKNRKGDRLFRPEDVKNLELIYHLLRQRKFTIDGAKEFIKSNKKKADVHLQLTRTLEKFRNFLLELKANIPS